jgi:putative restriction endonuclease
MVSYEPRDKIDMLHIHSNYPFSFLKKLFIEKYLSHRNKMSKIELFEKTHVYKAAKTWDADPGKYGFRDGRLNAVLINGKEYPPKAIAAYACEHANTKKLRPENFKGGRKGIYLRRLEDLEFEIIEKENSKKTKRSKRKEEIDEIIKIINKNKTTEILSAIFTRLGQGQFRKSLMKRWGGYCAVSGNTCLAVLRASHIKRWADCIGKESSLRLDPENGILLAANIDCLFESGLIGFKKTGELIKSKKISEKQALVSGIDKGMKLMHTPTKKQAKLLDEHRRRHRLNNTEY